jgi:formylglycine-generating enzyme required for sulfatase activity
LPDVFISYNREDRETARLISSALEAEGFSVWWDAALRAGETYDEVTEHNLRTAGAVVVLWSKRSANSKWVRAEATVGERSSTLVPALIEDCERPIRFELVQTADFRHWRGDRADANWRAFIQDVKTAISKKPRAAAAPAAAPALTAADVSVETAFWNSIKDGSERADFEAYLSRYPAGHFAALAKNRLNALSRPAPAAPRPAPAPQAQVRPASQPAPQRAATPPPRPSPAAAPEKKSGGGLLIGGVIAALAVAGVAAFILMRGGENPAAGTVAEAAPAAAVEAAPAEPASEPASDILADAATAEGPPDAAVAAAEPAIVEPEAPPKPEAPAAAEGPFRDCDACPLMARLPGGTYLRGSPEDEAGRNAYEGPQREVRVPAFAIGVYEVTRDEWNACAADGGCPDKGYSVDGSMPALGVSFREGERYVAWLSKKTGKKYRIPTEAEWEYAARGGSEAAYWWGERYEAGKAATGAPAAVGAHAANGFGLHDVTGNAREWVADCYVNNYVNAPDDGSAVTEGDCSKRVVRGGAWSNPPADLRVANRSRIDAGVRAQYMGLRVAADLN